MAAIVMQLKSNLIRVAFPFILASLSLLAATNQLSSYRIPVKLAEKGEFANVPKLDETPVEKPIFAEDPPNDSKKLPLAILHMGPHKTGTTSIQKTLRKGEFFESMDEDGWDASIVRGSEIANVIRLFMSPYEPCKKKHKSCKEESWYKALNATVRNGAERGKDLLISDEVMSTLDYASSKGWGQLSSLLKEHYRVHAILVYRRYFEWLPSYYNQQHKIKGPYGNLLRRWSSEGGVVIPPFTEYWDQALNNTSTKAWLTSPTDNKWDIQTGMPIHNILKIKSRLEAQSISVTVMNFHSGDVMENFFCSALPHSNRTCQQIKNCITVTKNKTTKKFDYDIIATAAQEAGLLRDGVDRSSAIAWIKKFLERTNQTVERDLPLKCPEKSKENLLRQISYEAEEQLMPSLLPSFNASFAAAIEKHKFCNVDTKILVQNETWRSFLSSIGSSKENGHEKKR